MNQTQSLAQVLRLNDDLQSKNTSLAISVPTKKIPAALALISQFGNAEEFLVAYNPKNQIRFTINIRRAYTGAAPSLATIKSAFGYGTSLSWLAIQLFDLAEFSGCRNKFSEEQIDDLSRLIMEEYYIL